MYSLSEDWEAVHKIDEIIDSMRKEFEDIVDEFFRESPDAFELFKKESKYG